VRVEVVLAGRQWYPVGLCQCAPVAVSACGGLGSERSSGRDPVGRRRRSDVLKLYLLSFAGKSFGKANVDSFYCGFKNVLIKAVVIFIFRV